MSNQSLFKRSGLSGAVRRHWRPAVLFGLQVLVIAIIHYETGGFLPQWAIVGLIIGAGALADWFYRPSPGDSESQTT